jgi:hypothetical protein
VKAEEAVEGAVKAAVEGAVRKAAGMVSTEEARWSTDLRCTRRAGGVPT